MGGTIMSTRSYYAEYWVIGSGTLIGGVRRSQSSRFGRRQDAEQRLSDTIDLNGADRCEGTVHESDKYPEIFIHCGPGPAQAIGGKCFRCHKELTVDDAKQAGYEHEVRELGIAYGVHFDLLGDEANEDEPLPVDWETSWNQVPINVILPRIPDDRHPDKP
jgi:hypothetical protein